jgi:hydrogenase maturation protein HypF
MGRWLDAIASLLGLIDMVRYEGHGAMLLQATAEKCQAETRPYTMQVQEDIIAWQPVVDQVIADSKAGRPVEEIAHAVHQTLAHLVIQLAAAHHINHIAVSGGVWQNALLVDLLCDAANAANKTIYFHQQVSPNDECIALGQLALHAMRQQTELDNSSKMRHQSS